jgi:hypothetical protein
VAGCATASSSSRATSSAASPRLTTARTRTAAIA